MKGIQLFALLGSLSLLAVCVPQVTLAGEPASKPATAAGESFDESKAEKDQSRQLTLDQIIMMQSAKKTPTASDSAKQTHDEKRGVALDSLFQSFKSESHTTMPVAHSTVNEHHKAQATHANHKQPAVATTPPAKALGKSEVAIYKHTPTEAETMVAVSHQVISHGSTPVIVASLDRPGTVPKYKSGDHMVINLKALQDCKVLVFDYDNENNITQLWPNSFDTDGTLAAGQTVEIGGDSSRYTLDIDGKGLEQVFIYTYPSSEKLPGLEMAMAPVPNTPFRSTKITRAQYDHLISASREYFKPAAATADSRGVHVTAKEGAGNAAFSAAPANKVELTFQIEK